MTASEYIRQTFLDFGVRLSDAALLGIAGRGGLDAGAEVDFSSVTPLDVAIVKSVPMLLLMPKSISEGGVSMSRADMESIMSWYSIRCREFGLDDELSGKPKVTFY